MRIGHIGELDFREATGTGESLRGILAIGTQIGIENVIYSIGNQEAPPDLPIAYVPLMRLVRDVKSRMRRDRIDVAHLHGGFIPGLRPIAARLEVPYVMTPHGTYQPAVITESRTMIKRSYLRIWERPLLNGARAVVALSETERGYLRAFTNAPVAVVPNVYDEVLADAVWGRREGAPIDGPVIFLGRGALHAKGLDRLTRLAWDADNHQFRLHLSAQDRLSADVARLKALAPTNVGICPPVYRGAKIEALTRARAYVHLSRREGLSLSIIEAAASGLPLILSPETNVAEEAEAAGACVVISNTGDHRQALAMLNDSEALARMAHNARAWALANFSRSAVATALSNLYASAA